MINEANLREAIFEAVKKYVDQYNSEFDAQVGVQNDPEAEDDDIVVDGGAEHGVFYIAIMSD